MAKPRVFISSTFYDLQQIRANIDQFIEDLGYESVRNEEGDIPYGNDERLEEYCYKEIRSVDILVNIIGGRYGSSSSKADNSITQQELKTALEENKQVYIFIQKDVFYEYRTYLLNKDNTGIKYKYVDNVNIYKFIEEIYSLPVNNNIKDFETSSDITHYLKSQFAGLFQRFLEEQTKLKEASLIHNLQETAKNLDSLVSYLRTENDGKNDEINRILIMNHPLVSNLRNRLKIPYNFYIEGYKDLIELLNARGFHEDKDAKDADYYVWRKRIKNDTEERCVKIAKTLFGEEGNLLYVKLTDWLDKYFIYEESKVQPLVDDLPF